MSSLIPMVVFRAFDTNGLPLAGGKLYSYQAGTNTPLATYTDQTGTVANTNPVILDSTGSANIWLTGSYKINLTDSAGVQQPKYPVDNVFDIQTQIGGAYGNVLNIWAGTAAGTANDLTLTPSPALTSIPTGQKLRFKVSTDNTAGSTINVSSIGQVPVRKMGLSGALIPLVSGDMKANEIQEVSYDGTVFQLLNPFTADLLPFSPRVLSGLSLSNNGTDPTNSIDIQVGYACDSTGASYQLPTVFTKVINTAFAAGSGNGGLFTGVVANTTYHVWLIRNTSTQAIDVGFDVSVTGANTPAGYTKIARIGSVLREAAANVLFTQVGDKFFRKALANDVAGVTLNTTATAFPLSVPAGLNLEAMFKASVRSATASSYAAVYSPLQNVQVITTAGPEMNLGVGAASATSAVQGQDYRITTDTSKNVMAVGFGSMTFYIYTYGWIDRRGKED